MNNLYYPNKPSKLEEYNQKLKERELYTNNILDRFIENGSGAPKHDKYGNLITTRRKYLNDDYEDITVGESMKNDDNSNIINLQNNNGNKIEASKSLSNIQTNININNKNPNNVIINNNKTSW